MSMIETGCLRDIIQLGNPILRKSATPVNDFNSESIQRVIADMQATLADSHGIGLAAPQIGESLQIVIIASKPNPRYPAAPEMDPVVMINPQMEVIDNSVYKDWEGCLSIPGIRARVPRYQAVKIGYLDQFGQQATLQLTDFVARVFQHEFDHLQGKVYLDRVEDNSDIIAESEYMKLFD
jgi:peptide deformylase